MVQAKVDRQEWLKCSTKAGRRKGHQESTGSTEQHTVFKAKLLGLVLIAKLIFSEQCAQSLMIGADSQAAIQAIGHIRDKLV